MTYTQALSTVGYALLNAFPGSETARKIASAAGFIGVGADVFLSKRAQRMRHEFERNVYLSQAEMYRREADTMKQASKYLAEEGSTPDTDCFSCATAHLAGMEGALRRAAKEAEKEGGKCGPSCQKWVHIAAQEPAALFARDWTEEKYDKLPPEQKRLLDRYSPQVEEQMKKIAPTPEGEGVLKAAALLKESIRFAEAGDDIRHPEVEWRRLEAEAELSAAERLRPGTLTPDIAQDLRHLRQAVGSGITDTGRLVDAAKKADELSLKINSRAWGEMTADDLLSVAEAMHDIRSSFAADRFTGDKAYRHIGESRPTDDHHRISEEVIATYTIPGIRAIAGMPQDQLKIAFDNVVKRLEERGVRVRFRDLPTTEEYDIGGLYGPSSDVIALNASKMSKDNFAMQTLLHEGGHALLHNKACHPVMSNAGYEDMPEEKEAEAVSLAAMIDLGLPVELWDGREMKPGERKIDWDKLREKAGPTAEENVRWAANWLVRAAKGEDGLALAAEKCPALRKVG